MPSFSRAVRGDVGLIVVLSGGTGSGKTMSALRLAQGIVGRAGTFALIDTESGRARHYAPRAGEEPNFVDSFRFDHCDLRAPFAPLAYTEAIRAADSAGYPVIVVDSLSHVWAGDGGVLDAHESELDRMAGEDERKREACKMAAWVRPKMEHKSMVQRLLQVRAHLVLCLRAEEKIEMIREDGRLKVIPKRSLAGHDGWVPVCEKSLPFEATCSFMLLASEPGVPVRIKLQLQHHGIFPPDQRIDETCGERLLAWASGAAAPPVVTIDAEQLDELVRLITENRIDRATYRDWLKLPDLASLPAARYEAVRKGLLSRLARTHPAPQESPEPETVSPVETGT